MTGKAVSVVPLGRNPVLLLRNKDIPLRGGALDVTPEASER